MKIKVLPPWFPLSMPSLSPPPQDPGNTVSYFLQFNCAPEPPRFRDTVSRNGLCKSITIYLYLAEKVVAKICPAQFFPFSMSGIFQTLSYKAHWPWQSQSESFFACAGFSLRNSVPRNCRQASPNTDLICFLPSPRLPWRVNDCCCGALGWHLSVILRQENKRERFKGEMDYYLIVYALSDEHDSWFLFLPNVAWRRNSECCYGLIAKINLGRGVHLKLAADNHKYLLQQNHCHQSWWST